MDSLTDSITDLEEAFDLEVPCGGNNSPVKRPCPYSATAQVVTTHTICGIAPTSLKCISCLMEWMQGTADCVCIKCGYRAPKHSVYRPL